MPTVHKISRAFLAQVGVSHPPRTPKEIKLWLRRDPDYFSINPRGVADTAPAIGGDSGVGHANGADDHQLSTPEELLGNIDAPKDTSGDGEDAAQQMPMDSVGAFDVPVAETVKKRRSNKPCDDDTTSLMKTPTKMILRKKTPSDACSSAPLSTRSKNQGLISNSTKRKRKASSLDNDLVSINPKTSDDCNTDDGNKMERLPANGGSREDQISQIKSWFSHRPSGKWSADIKYHGKTRYIGSFSTKNDAALANKVAVELLTASEKESECNTSAEDNIVLHVKAAKEAALEAVKESKHQEVESDVISNHRKTSSDVSNKKAEGSLVAEKLDSSCQNQNSQENSNKFDSCKDEISQNKTGKRPGPIRKGAVCQLPSGKWQVSVGYRGKQRYIGAFPAQDDAESAKKIAVEILTSSENKSECKISAEDIELYVKAAKEAAAEAVKKKNGVVVPAVTPEPAVKKMKPFPEQQASRPPIMRGRKGGKVWKKSSKTKSKYVGVYATSNGKWKIEVRYRGRRCCMSSFCTEYEAAIAKGVIIDTLHATRHSSLSAQQIESNMQLAKKKALATLDQRKRAGHLTPNKTNCSITINGRNEMESALSKLTRDIMGDSRLRLESESHSDGPKLALGRWQREKNFMQWLADRKKRWSNDSKMVGVKASPPEKEAAEKALAKDIQKKPTKSFSVTPVPSFYYQDLKRIRTIQGDLVSSRKILSTRETLAKAQTIYDKAYNRSIEIQQQKATTMTNLTKLTDQHKIEVRHLEHMATTQVSVAKKHWERRQYFRKEMENTLGEEGALVRDTTNAVLQDVKDRVTVRVAEELKGSGLGTPCLQDSVNKAKSEEDLNKEVAATMLGHMVDSVERRLQDEKADAEEFVPPSAPNPNTVIADPETGETMVQLHKRREAAMRKEISKLDQSFKDAEAKRGQAWLVLSKANKGGQQPSASKPKQPRSRARHSTGQSSSSQQRVVAAVAASNQGQPRPRNQMGGYPMQMQSAQMRQAAPRAAGPGYVPTSHYGGMQQRQAPNPAASSSGAQMMIQQQMGAQRLTTAGQILMAQQQMQQQRPAFHPVQNAYYAAPGSNLNRGVQPNAAVALVAGLQQQAQNQTAQTIVAALGIQQQVTQTAQANVVAQQLAAVAASHQPSQQPHGLAASQQPPAAQPESVPKGGSLAKYGYGDRYSASNVKARKNTDGTVVPASAPKLLPDGKFARPAGRQRKGMDWDADKGVWFPVPEGQEGGGGGDE